MTRVDRLSAPAYTRTPRPAVRARPGRVAVTARGVVRGVGEVLITLGVVVALFVVYELFVTNIFTEQGAAPPSRRAHSGLA